MLVTILLLVFCIFCVVLKKAYHHLEISPDSFGAQGRELRQVVKHVVFVNLMLELILLAGLALFAINIAFDFGVIQAFSAIIITLLAIFVVIPNIRTSALSLKFAVIMAKPLGYIVKKLEKPVIELEKLVAKTNKKFHNTEPLSKEALVGLLREQRDIAGSELKTELELAIAGLDLNNQKIAYSMVRKQKAKLVSSDDLVGPILLSELHDTGRKIFAAKDADGEIVGTIRLADLTELKSGGKVKKALNKQVVKIDKDALAIDAINKFIAYGLELMIVEEAGRTVGVLYLEDILKIIVSEPTPQSNK